MTGKKKPKAAIVGVGATGAFLSLFLKPYFEIDGFEKSRGIGGRAAYRKYDAGYFIHGAQAFVARKKEFLHAIQTFLDREQLYAWNPKVINFDSQGKRFKRLWFEQRYAHQHSLAQFFKDISAFNSLYVQKRIKSIVLNQRQKVMLTDENEKQWGTYDVCFVTAPPVQAKAMLNLGQNHNPKLHTIQSQYALMISLSQSNPAQWELAYGHDTFLQKVLRMKTENTLSNDYVLFSDLINNIEDKNADLLVPNAYQQLKNEFLKFMNLNDSSIVQEQQHFWRYRKTQLSTDLPFYKLDGGSVYLCGDSFLKTNDIEAAYLSAKAVMNDLDLKGAVDV